MKNRFLYIALIAGAFCLIEFLDLSAAVLKRDRKELKEEVQKSDEEIFIEKNFNQSNCTLWETGKLFIYVADKLNITLHPVVKSVGQDTLSYRNKIFTFDSILEETIWGDKYYANLVFDCEGRKYKFETNKTFQEISDSLYTPFIPDLISLDRIEVGRELLIGKTFYIKSSSWYDEQGRKIEGRKLIPVTVSRLEPGNSVLPVQLFFKDDTGKESSVFLTLSPEAKSGQYISFDRIFSFKNPRLKHKTISDEVWNEVTRGKVKKGMTKEECRLSLGLPNDVRQMPTYGGLKEQWLYNTGVYLYFEDGLLTDFRQ